MSEAKPQEEAPHEEAPHEEAPHADPMTEDAPHEEAPHADPMTEDAPHVEAPRGETPRVTRVAAYALAQDSDGRLLLCRMATGHPGAGKWTLPGGGLHFGEAPEVGLLRELAEETGLEGRILEIAGVTSRALRISRPTGDQHMHALGICYRVAVTGGTLRHEPDGSTDRAEWFTRAQIDGLPVTHLVVSALSFLP